MVSVCGPVTFGILILNLPNPQSDSILLIKTDTFFYTDDDFVFEIKPHNPGTNFDELLRNKWNAKMNEGNIFWYKLKITHQRTVSDKFFLQFNRERAALRRPPAAIYSVMEPFDSKKFNFNKIKEEEKLFVFINKKNQESHKNLVIVNVSPLEYCHVLLIPDPEECLSQVLTEATLNTALEFSLLSGSRYFRVCFNGLGGYASVNHLHFHGYLLERDMFLESAIVEEVAYPCYQLSNYPAKSFVFQIRNIEEYPFILRSIFRLVKLLQMKNISHNLFISRGLDFESARTAPDKSGRNCVRIYVWARKPTWGTKELTAFNLAACELFGHMVIKNETDYHALNEENINAALSEMTSQPFDSVISDVKKLY